MEVEVFETPSDGFSAAPILIDSCLNDGTSDAALACGVKMPAVLNRKLPARGGVTRVTRRGVVAEHAFLQAVDVPAACKRSTVSCCGQKHRRTQAEPDETASDDTKASLVTVGEPRQDIRIPPSAAGNSPVPKTCLINEFLAF